MSHSVLIGWILEALDYTTVATGGGYENITVILYILELILCSYDTFVNFLCTVNCAMYGLCVPKVLVGFYIL